jgi:hypothetical protein
MRPATQSEADAFARLMCARFHARVVRKSMAVEMTMAAAAFDVLKALRVGVPSGADFLEHYTTTLGPIVYLQDGLSPDAQIEVLTHEMQHVWQFWGGAGQAAVPGGVGFAFLYLAEPEARVRLEADAYRAGLEVRYRRTQQMPSLDALVWPLEGGYALDAAHVQLGRSILEMGGTSLHRGRVSTMAGKVALECLAQISPELVS